MAINGLTPERISDVYPAGMYGVTFEGTSGVTAANSSGVNQSIIAISYSKLIYSRGELFRLYSCLIMYTFLYSLI